MKLILIKKWIINLTWSRYFYSVCIRHSPFHPQSRAETLPPYTHPRALSLNTLPPQALLHKGPDLSSERVRLSMNLVKSGGAFHKQQSVTVKTFLNYIYESCSENQCRLPVKHFKIKALLLFIIIIKILIIKSCSM